MRQFKWSICFVGIALLINALLGALLAVMPQEYRSAEFTMGVVIALVVSLLITLLYIIATGFAAINLNDKTQALGLPEGSVRALIALILIVMWIGLSVYLFKESADTTKKLDEPTRQLAQQLITTMGTLVVAVAGFYFGTSSAKAGNLAQLVADTAAPRISGVATPIPAARVGEPIQITGENLTSVRTVQLRRRANNGATEVRDGTEITTSPTTVKCLFDLSNASGEPWDIYVETADGRSDTNNRAIKVG